MASKKEIVISGLAQQQLELLAELSYLKDKFPNDEQERFERMLRRIAILSRDIGKTALGD